MPTINHDHVIFNNKVIHLIKNIINILSEISDEIIIQPPVYNSFMEIIINKQPIYG